MRTTAILLAFAATLAAQTPGAAPVTVTSAIGATRRPGISRETFNGLEKEFDKRLASTGGAHPVDILGLTRGVYLDDYGVVFTAEVSLAQTPAPNPFRREITPEQRNDIHRQKLENLPLLQKTMHDMVREIAISMNAVGVRMGLLRADAKVVLAVRFLYLPYENTAGLPGQIVMKADLQGALANNIRMEEQ